MPTRHQIVTVKTKFRWKASVNDGSLRLPWYQLKDPQICMDFIRRVKEKYTEHAEIVGMKRRRNEPNQKMSTEMPVIFPSDILWDKLEKAIIMAAESIPTKEENINMFASNDETTTQLRIHDIFRTSQSPQRFDSLVKEHSITVNENITQECLSLQQNFQRYKRSSWRHVKMMTGHTSSRLRPPGKTKSEQLCNVRLHFQNTVQLKEVDNKIKFAEAPKSFIPISDGPFDLNELTTALKDMATGKAPGIDSIPIEALRVLNSDPFIQSILLHLINMVRESGRAPQTWKRVIQVPVPKKGDLGNMNNWRPICLIVHAAKLMNRMILNRILPTVDAQLSDCQYGFRPNRATTGAQATLIELCQKASRENPGVALGFVDFRQAFPSVSFFSIRAALEAFHIPQHLSSMIMSMYEKTEAVVRCKSGVTDTFPIQCGTLQGDVLAPVLFLMVLDRVMVEVYKENEFGLILRRAGTKRQGKPAQCLNYLAYADDLVLICPSLTNLNRVMERLEQTAAKVNLRLNIGVNKTAWMTVGQVNDAQGDLILTNGGLVPRITEYRYLGLKITNKGVIVNFEDRINLAWAATHRLQSLWKSGLTLVTKFHLFESLVSPLLLYGCGNFSLIKKDADFIDCEVNRMRRLALGVRTWDGTRGTPCDALYGNRMRLSNACRVLRVQMLGHLIRGNNPFKSVMLWRKATGKKYRPTLSEACAEDMELDVEDLNVLAGDRDWWASRVKFLREFLESHKSYMVFGSRSWKKVCQDLDTTTYKVLEGIEEGTDHSPLSADSEHIYVDGAVSSEAGKPAAGSGIVIVNSNGVRTRQHVLPPECTSPDRAELHSFLLGIQAASSSTRNTVIHTDSHYVWDWYHNVRVRFSIIGYGGMPNADLLTQIQGAIKERCTDSSLYVIKVRAHCGNSFNEKADEIARKAQRTAARRFSCVIHTQREGNKSNHGQKREHDLQEKSPHKVNMKKGKLKNTEEGSTVRIARSLNPENL